MRSVFVLSGISGSGKSKIAKVLSNTNKALIVSADDYFITPEGNYQFDPTKIGEAHNKCMRDFISLCQRKISLIVVDNTNTTSEEIAPYFLVGSSLGYNVELFTVKCDPYMAFPRNSHECSLEIVLQQYVRLMTRKLLPWWKNTEFDQDEVYRFSLAIK